MSALSRIARSEGLRSVGLNADWSVEAFFLGPGVPNRTNGAAYLLDLEDRIGGWSIVRRFEFADGTTRFEKLADGRESDEAALRAAIRKFRK